MYVLMYRNIFIQQAFISSRLQAGTGATKKKPACARGAPRLLRKQTPKQMPVKGWGQVQWQRSAQGSLRVQRKFSQPSLTGARMVKEGFLGEQTLEVVQRLFKERFRDSENNMSKGMEVRISPANNLMCCWTGKYRAWGSRETGLELGESPDSSPQVCKSSHVRYMNSRYPGCFLKVQSPIGPCPLGIIVQLSVSLPYVCSAPWGQKPCLSHLLLYPQCLAQYLAHSRCCMLSLK